VGNNRHTHVKANDDLTIDGEKKEQTAANHSFIVNGTLHLSAGTAWLTDSGTELHIKAGQKAVIEAGAEITLMAGGALAKIDPAGVHLMGASIRLNSGGAPGVGGGVKAQAADMPGLVEKAGTITAPPEDLPEAPTRPMAKTDQIRAIKNAANQGKGICQVCSPESQGAI
jgi:type VI secretion system secreted protein VgrG